MKRPRDPESGGKILSFPRKRGRPKSTRPKHDCGTPELTMKRLLDVTAETLDLCLERGIITQRQHWCGIHLRWLYTLRHGAPGVRAIDPTHLGGIEIKNDDPEWRGAREQEYHEAVAKLGKHLQLLLNVCIYNERPKFLSLRKSATPASAKDAAATIEQLRAGLDILARLWKRPEKKS